MSDKITLSLHTLPVECVYCILDNLDELTILLSVRGVCTRLNAITDTYHRYQVNFTSIFKLDFHRLQCILHFDNMQIN
jgi:F-box domain